MQKTCTKCNCVKDLSEYYKHSEGKYKHHASCKSCHLDQQKQWRKTVVGQTIIKEYSRRYFNTQHGKAVRRKGHLLRKYNMTLQEYEQRSQQQSGACLICGQKKKLYVDHNHETNIVRGLLCCTCNLFVGKVESNGKLLEVIKQYLWR